MISKYLLLLVALLLMVVGVQGLALDFQNPSDFTEQITCWGDAGTRCSWTQSATGANSYLTTSKSDYPYAPCMGVVSQTPLIMDYSAATTTTGIPTPHSMTGCAVLYDVAGNVMGTLSPVSGAGRYEVKVVGDSASLYYNGVWQQSVAGLTQNPHYVGWGSSGYLYFGWHTGVMWDDIIWGTTESRYIFGMPESGYFLMKDILNPSASGFYRVNQTVANGSPTLITSTTFTSTFGKNSGTNETVVLSSPTGGSGLTYSTGTAYAGTINWNLTQFFASSAPYGLYQTDINPQTNSPGFATSDWIPYIGSGASIHFDKNSYAVGETATATVVVSDSYYDTDVYSYHVVIQDIYGTEAYDEPISFSVFSPYTGIAEYQWTDDNDEGVYYGLIYAKRLSDNEELLMNYDTADLNSNLIVSGYVFNAETAGVISGATVNVTQGVTTDSLTTAADGNYSSTSAFTANAPTTIVASKSGYETYQHVFTPLYAGTIQINLTLMPTSPTYTGIALGGIARTPPYNRTINSATVTINKTGIGNYIATTNSVGYYIQNSMPNGTIWDIWGSKSGFSTSVVYQKLVVGI